VLHASDGGGAVTMNASNASRTWTQRDYPTPQLYHIIATSGSPYFVCGAQQDASSFCITSANPAAANVVAVAAAADEAPRQRRRRRQRRRIGGRLHGAGSARPGCVFTSVRTPMAEAFSTKRIAAPATTGEVSPYPRMFSGEESAVIKERWQWTYPIIFSTVDPHTLYVGSQHLWKTTNGGQDWTRISPDLTRHDPKTMGPSGGPITRDMMGRKSMR